MFLGVYILLYVLNFFFNLDAKLDLVMFYDVFSQLMNVINFNFVTRNFQSLEWRKAFGYLEFYESIAYITFGMLEVS